MFEASHDPDFYVRGMTGHSAFDTLVGVYDAGLASEISTM